MPSPRAPAKATACLSGGRTYSLSRSTLPPNPPVASTTARRAVTRRVSPSTESTAPVTRPSAVVSSRTEALSQIGTLRWRRL